MTADDQVFAHRHVAEDLRCLERPHNSKTAASCDGRACNTLTFKDDIAAIRRKEARYNIEQRALAGAVRSDQTRDGSLRDIKRHVTQNRQPEKAFGYTVAPHQHILAHASSSRRGNSKRRRICCCTKPPIPRGRKITVRTNASANSNGCTSPNLLRRLGASVTKAAPKIVPTIVCAPPTTAMRRKLMAP